MRSALGPGIKRTPCKPLHRRLCSAWQRNADVSCGCLYCSLWVEISRADMSEPPSTAGVCDVTMGIDFNYVDMLILETPVRFSTESFSVIAITYLPVLSQ